MAPDFFRSIKSGIASLFASAPLTEISPQLRAHLEAKTEGGKVPHCLKARKVFHKRVSSFMGDTFFRTVAVITGGRFLLLKESSEYNEIVSFPLRDISDSAIRSDGGKPSLVISLKDGSEIRLAFSSDDPEIDVFARILSAAQPAASGGLAGKALFCGQCGRRSQPANKFCAGCGSPLDFTLQETTMID